MQCFNAVKATYSYVCASGKAGQWARQIHGPTPRTLQPRVPGLELTGPRQAVKVTSIKTCHSTENSM